MLRFCGVQRTSIYTLAKINVAEASCSCCFPENKFMLCVSYMLSDQDIVLCFPTGYNIILLSTASKPATLASQLPYQCVSDTFSQGVRRQEREANHSVPMLKMSDVIPPLPLCLHVSQKENLLLLSYIL